MTFSTVRAIRGAITVDENTVPAISDATVEVLTAMLARNGVHTDDVISVFFTSTADLTATFPATAARDAGFADVPLMCASEIPVPDSMAMTIRVMMHVSTDKARSDIRHAYLRDAASLRSDLD